MFDSFLYKSYLHSPNPHRPLLDGVTFTFGADIFSPPGVSMTPPPLLELFPPP